MDWEDLRHFLALARTGTFLGAARQIGVEHATISRRVASLERSLGRKLVDKRGRRVVLTAEGERVASQMAPFVEQAAAVEQLGRSSSTSMQGHVRISAPPALSSALLAKPVVAIRQEHPGIAITLVGETRFASLGQREADIAIRMSRPVQGDYSITKLTDLKFRFYAAPSYLTTVPPKLWNFIGYDESMKGSPQQTLLQEYAAGRQIGIRSSLLEVQALAAELEGGVVLLPEFAVSDSRALQAVDGDVALARELWLVVHADIKDVPSVRFVVDALKQELRERLVD